MPPGSALTVSLQEGPVSIELARDPALIGVTVRAVVETSPRASGPELGLGLGGAGVTPRGPVVDIRLITSQPVGDDVAARLCLPAVDDAQWLYAHYENGQFAGYLVFPGPRTGNVVCGLLPINALQGTLFLPATLTPAFVQNHDPVVHVWSGPTREARDFGFAGPQFTTFTVLAPQVTNRLFVYSPVVDNFAWIDTGGVGPSGPP